MTRYYVSLLLAAYTCFAWGLIAPMTVRFMHGAGAGNFHPAHPLLWNAFGNIVIALVVLLVTGGSPLKVWSWHWSGWGIAFVWASGSTVFTLALYLAGSKTSVPNLIAAAYPSLVTSIALWYFFGEAMTAQKIIGFAVTLIGVALVVLA